MQDKPHSHQVSSNWPTIHWPSKNGFAILKYSSCLPSDDWQYFTRRPKSGCLSLLCLGCAGGPACSAISVIWLGSSREVCLGFERLLCPGIFAAGAGFCFAFGLFVWRLLLCFECFALVLCCLVCSCLSLICRRFGSCCLPVENELQLVSLGWCGICLLMDEIFLFFILDLILCFELGCCKALLLNLGLRF